jgi:hypothetical protein
MMMTPSLLQGRLLPEPGWFFRWIKIYSRVAIGSACAFLVVAGWLAENSMVRALITAAAGIAAVIMFAGCFVPRAPSARMPTAEINEPRPRHRGRAILTFRIAGLWVSFHAGMRRHGDRTSRPPSER